MWQARGAEQKKPPHGIETVGVVAAATIAVAALYGEGFHPLRKDHHDMWNEKKNEKEATIFEFSFAAATMKGNPTPLKEALACCPQVQAETDSDISRSTVRDLPLKPGLILLHNL